jgi:hypothetical protein
LILVKTPTLTHRPINEATLREEKSARVFFIAIIPLPPANKGSITYRCREEEENDSPEIYIGR